MKIFSIETEESKIFKIIILENCSVQTLLDSLLNNNISNEDKMKIMNTIIETISYIHSKNIAYCDIKLENMILGDNKNVKIIDFGMSKNYNTKYNDNKCGTPNYAAPELFEQGKVNFFKSDIWSIGGALYAIETKKFPYICKNILKIKNCDVIL